MNPKRETKYDICKQFGAGYGACLAPLPRSLSESDHWLAGWDAGYAARKVKNEQLDRYLISIGHEPQAKIILAAKTEAACADCGGTGLVEWDHDQTLPSRTVICESCHPDGWITPDKISRELFNGDIWWHDNGEQIYPVNIAWSPTSLSFFATLGQWGWTRAQDVIEMGGMWKPCIEPEPNQAFRDKWDAK